MMLMNNTIYVHMRKASIAGHTSRGDCGGQGVSAGIGKKPRRQAEKNITFFLLLGVEPLVPDILHKLLATSKQGAEVDELLLLLIGRLGVEFWDSSVSWGSSHRRLGTPPSPIGVLELYLLVLGPSCLSWSL
jgi:hypothetical protein